MYVCQITYIMLTFTHTSTSVISAVSSPSRESANATPKPLDDENTIDNNNSNNDDDDDEQSDITFTAIIQSSSPSPSPTSSSHDSDVESIGEIDPGEIDDLKAEEEEAKIANHHSAQDMNESYTVGAYNLRARNRPLRQ